jgi:hypothetical protein
MKGAEAPDGKWECPGLLLGKTTDPLTSCEVEAKAELVTVRLAELVSARLSDGCRIPLQSADEVHDRNWSREEGKA